VWTSTSPRPTRDHPELALVLIPKREQSASEPQPTWVFPFNRPAAPGPGDNQALAVNTTNGSTLYDVAFALVWADGTSVTNANEAYAFASCRQCTTVAVAFQVVLITGSAHIVIPQNVAGAVNYSCVQCLTYALAQQLVLSVPSELSPQTRQRLDALWAQIGAFAATIQDLPLDQIRDRLLTFQEQIQNLVVQASGAAKSDPTPTTTAPVPSSAPSAGPAPVTSTQPASPTATRPASTEAPTNPAPSTTAQTSSPGPTSATPAQTTTAPATSAPTTTSTLEAP
jgi:putative peptide zinc metalloprotease protein